MSKWIVSEQGIYDENGTQIIEASEWYMREDLKNICNEHNLLENSLELLKEFSFYCVDESVEEHCNRSLKVQDFLKNTKLKSWIEREIQKAKCDVCETYDECPVQDGTC